MNYQLTPEIIKEIEHQTGLVYLDQTEGNNVCFRNENEQLRDEFKSGFTLGELNDYIYTSEQNNESILPVNDMTFWKRVRQASILKNKKHCQN